MSVEREAAQVIEQWVQGNVVNKLLLLLDADDYRPDEPISGPYGRIRLHRLPTGQVKVKCTNKLVVEALVKHFMGKYMVRHTHVSHKVQILFIAHKSEQA